MSIMSEYTIETKLTKDEVVKMINNNTKDVNPKNIFSLLQLETKLPFYGRVTGDEFRIHPTHYQYLTNLFASLEGSIVDEYDTTKVYVQPKGASLLMKLSIITMPIPFAIVTYMGITRGNLPINIILPAFCAAFVLAVAMTLGFTRYYVHKAKKALQELFKT